jgi:hypothetical protein
MSDIESVNSTSARKTRFIDNNVITMRKKGIKVNRRGEKSIINVDYNIYGTGLCGNIRSAVTGERYEHRVGSNDEHLYFKLIMTSGPKVLTLFYKSPAEYELHQQRELDEDLKVAWRYKRDRYVNETA